MKATYFLVEMFKSERKLNIFHYFVFYNDNRIRMFLKKRILFFTFLFAFSFVDAQIYFKSATKLQGFAASYYPDEKLMPANFSDKKMRYADNLKFDQTFHWKKRVNNMGEEKDAYLYHSVFYRDSIIGVRLVGFNFRLFHEKFDKGKLNFLRYWNRIKIGFSMILQKNYIRPYYPQDDFSKYLNFDFFIMYRYISKDSRGDAKTHYRKWTWSILFYSDFDNRIYSTFTIKPLGFAWVRLQYERLYLKRQNIGFTIDVALNRNGYSRSLVTSTKDSYKGIRLFAGPFYDIDTKSWSLNLGIRYDYRNH